MACDAQSLVTEATPYLCCVPKGMELSVMILLAARAAGVSTDPQSLIVLAGNIQCCIPSGMEQSAMIAAICEAVP